MSNDVLNLMLLRCFTFSKGNLNKIPKKKLLGTTDSNPVISSRNEKEKKISVLKEPKDTTQNEKIKKIEKIQPKS